MKFGHEFEGALKQDDYPPEWVQSAISYRQLKKCIKAIRQELLGLGLDKDTIERLWLSEDSPLNGGGLRYTFSGDMKQFQPKLRLLLDPDRVLVDATLAPETRALVQAMLKNQATTSDALQPLTHGLLRRDINGVSDNCVQGIDLGSWNRSPRAMALQSVDIPLTSDSQFFRLLSYEISGLSSLQEREGRALERAIRGLGKEISSTVEPQKGLTRSDLYVWREIFELYTDSGIFFSTVEQDSFERDSHLAHKQLQFFSNKLQELGLPAKLKRMESRIALGNFIRINLTLLKNVRFQELNVTAMTKILKKFDKRTALSARRTFPHLVAGDTFSSSTLAKAVCAQVCDQLLSLVPQLADYTCPVCFTIAYKPIRLQCSHVFCIRCMVVMQRAGSDYCPLCRDSVIMKADSANLDPTLTIFLRKYFPIEVKAKQKQNEYDAGVDKYGEEYDNKCRVM